MSLKPSAQPPVRATARSYAAWIADLKRRWRATQIKAAVAVNSELIRFYWDLGKDICERYPESNLGNEFYRQMSRDLEDGEPSVKGLSPQTLKYCGYFYRLYAIPAEGQQVVDLIPPKGGQRVVDRKILPQVAAKSSQPESAGIVPRLVEQLVLVPWGHHVQLIDKCKGNRDKALFYVRRTIRNGWSRSSLLNWLSTDLYEREGKAQTNFELTLPAADCDLARQLVKDPQVFEVFGLAEEHREADLKAAIVANIERTLLSLGRGVAFLGREYPVEIGGETKNIDLLFYVVPLHRYLVMEVKTTKYEPADLGQLSGYMAMAESVLNGPGDNPPVGILVCKEHNRVLAKIHLEKLGLPMGVTDYQIKRLLPTQAQLAKCYADAEAQLAAGKRGKAR